MKKIIITAAVFISVNTFGQEKPRELNCYNKWSAKFEERGVEDIKDGVYEDVIITNRQGAKAECNNGKAEVKGGKIIKFYLLLSDGTFEEFKRNWKPNALQDVTITNGISKTMVSIQGELINVLWPAKVKPKKAKPMSAPDPKDD